MINVYRELRVYVRALIDEFLRDKEWKSSEDLEMFFEWLSVKGGFYEEK